MDVMAQVFLRSRSGKSVRELGGSPLPDDLAEFTPTAAGKRTVREAFERLGFKVFEDSLGISLSIEGSPDLFSRVFGLPRKKILSVNIAESLELPAPPEAAPFVEGIFLQPPPELFGKT